MTHRAFALAPSLEPRRPPLFLSCCTIFPAAKPSSLGILPKHRVHHPSTRLTFFYPAGKSLCCRYFSSSPRRAYIKRVVPGSPTNKSDPPLIYCQLIKASELDLSYLAAAMAGLFKRLYDWLLRLFWYVCYFPSAASDAPPSNVDACLGFCLARSALSLRLLRERKKQCSMDWCITDDADTGRPRWTLR